jgi:hypothetical protein
MCKNPQVDVDGPAVAGLMASVAAVVSRRIAAVSADVYEVILRDIPEVHDDQAVLSLLASSVHSNVATCLQIMQHQMDLPAGAAGHAADRPAARLPDRSYLLHRLAPQRTGQADR